MKEIRKKMHGRSIRFKLGIVFMLASCTVFVVNIYTYYNANRAMGRMDSVYSSNIELNQLSETLSNLQKNLYQYLNTKSSETLEAYYVFEQDYYNLINNLNTKTMNSPTILMEKNIYNMSNSYLEQAGKAVEAKRGRDITKYKGSYAEAEKIYRYIQSAIGGLNTTVFLENSKSYSVLRSSMNFLMWASMILLLFIIGIVALWIIVMTRNITRPLINLAGAADEIAKGNIDVDFPIVDTGDEIETVAKACNKMIESIRDYIQKTKDNYKRENKLIENELIMKNDLKEAQLKYLQAQINPHFLFNTLNAGAQLAMMEGAEKTCLFVENMADFFRYNVRKMGKDTTIGEEISLVDSYVYILNVRFSGDIHFVKQVDERLLQVHMPSMILQPIVENAVNHGIRGMENRGRIRLSIYTDESYVCISVIDNGTGIDDKTIEKIMNGENVQDKAGKDSTGVALDNVINRLKRYYNEEQVFSIRRGADGGTEVIIYIPKCEDNSKGKE
ncbi:MAG: histidine kinase [Lachnospiraceae bacterium]